MVARPPIEKWNRAELEDNYHNVLQQMKEYQKKNQDLDKKITQLNSKFRRAVMDRKTNNQVVEKDKFDQLLNENHLLSMKLKSVKHQLLTYTAPTARAATASAMTGRSTFRPPSTMRRNPPPMSTGDRTNRPESVADSSRPGHVRIVEGSLAEKANIIRLNRQLRERNTQLNSLQFDFDSVKTQLGETKALLQQKTKEASDLAAAVNASASAGTESSIETEVLRKELSIAKQELSLLTAANERLVKQSLNQEIQLQPGEKDTSELRRTISINEERLKDKLKETEKKLRESQRHLTAWKNKAARSEAALKNQPSPPKIERAPIEDFEDEEEEEYIRPKTKKRQKMNERKKVDDVLARLYDDVTEILESHGAKDDDFITGGMSNSQKIAKWQKMYSELYEELEKVRNMLLLQHNINQKQTSEISLLREECERLVLEGQLRIKEITGKVEEKQKKIDVLEQQIHSIAYSGQKPLRSKEQITEDPELSTRLSIRLIGLRLLSSSGASSIFLSLEFFDFELQTTPVLKAEDQPLDFTTFYDVVVSNLFVHYLQSNGITLELYRAKSSSYELMAAGTVSLNDLIGRKTCSVLGGELKLRHASTGQAIAVISYELGTTRQLADALGSYKRAEAAQKLLPIEIPPPEPEWNELLVSVQRCSGINKISSEPLEVCVVYEFLAFSPYVTENATGSIAVEINSDKRWALPSEALQFFHDQEISFYLMDRGANKKDEGVLAMLSLPMAPLLGNSQIRGSFPMIKADGSEPGLFLDVCIKWQFDLPKVDLQPPLRFADSSEDADSPVDRAPPTPTVVEIPHEEAIHQDKFFEEEIESVSSSSSRKSEESFDTVEKVEPKSPVEPEIEEEEEEKESSNGSQDTFTKEIREAEIEDEEDRFTPVPDHLADLPPIAKPRFTRAAVSLDSERLSSEDDSGRRLVGFTSPLHRSIPPSETSSLSSPRREKPPVALPREGGRSVIKVKDRLEDEIPAEGREQTVSITIHRMRNTAYTPLMERRFEGMKFIIDWKFLDFPEQDCRVSESQQIPVVWNDPLVFQYTKEYRLSPRRVALLEQYVETHSHLEFCLVTDCGDESEELAVAALEMMRIPPNEPMVMPMLDVNGIRWADLEVTISYSQDIFDSNH